MSDRRAPKPRRRHHQVAKFLLKKWSVDGRVSMTARNGEHALVGPNDAAVQEHFNSFLDADGVRDTSLEDYFSDRIDGVTAPAILNVLDGSFDDDDLATIARFAAFQVARSPRFRDAHVQLAARLGPVAAQLAAQEHAEAGGSDIDADLVESYEYHPDANAFVRMMALSAHMRAQEFEKLFWTVAVCERPALILGDSPAVYFDPTVEPDQFVGLQMRPTAELRLPLSPTHLLLGSPTTFGSGGTIQATPELVASTNRQMARECTYAFFAVPGMPLADDLVLAPHPPRIPDGTFSPADPSDTTPTTIEYPTIADPELAEIRRRAAVVPAAD